MATIVSKKLSIDDSNIEQYCEANNVTFNVSGHAWRKWLNGSTDGYIVLKAVGMEVIYPNTYAKPFKADSTISASRSAGTCTVDLQFDGTEVHKESYTSGTQTSKSKSDITDAAVTNSTQSSTIRWHVYGKNGDNQRGNLLELTLYFNQYTVSANIGSGANGVKTVGRTTVVYDGEPAIFSAELYNGATWHGWYSDAACTTLVSADQIYVVTLNSDITLYASATIDAKTYNCSAIAKDGITTATVSDDIVPDGGECTFSAELETGYLFEGWYSDEGCTTLVSSSNPYLATITSDTTLYAKGVKKKFNVTVVSTEHGSAIVSDSVIAYGDSATVTFTPEDDKWELYGWYLDSSLTQLVSESNPYSFTVTEDITLYPKVYKKRYTVSISITGANTVGVKIIAVDYDSLTKAEIGYLKTGEYNMIDADKVYATDSASCKTSISENTATATVKCPSDMYVAMYVVGLSLINTTYYGYVKNYTWWPYYWYNPTQDASFTAGLNSNTSLGECICTAIAKDGISSVDATSPVVSTKEAIFNAEVVDGYVFAGWYSDEGCTTLVSSENPSNVVTPQEEKSGLYRPNATLTLYAKAIKPATTGIYLKQNGAYTQAQAIYKKVNGVWTTTDKSALDTTTKYKIINT